MPYPSVIAIDGPAGAGKSTLGALLAAHLGYLYFDTGVMYRALTLAALERGLNLKNGTLLEELAATIVIEVVPATMADGRQYTVRSDGQDVTWAIRQPEVEQQVSLVSSYPGVRRELVRQQQLVGRQGRVVMVGRDIGTVVMPDAELKIFLATSLDERARRRAHERIDQAEAHADIRADLARRDQLDAHVMRPAPDALMITTDGLQPEAVVALIMARIAS